MTLSGLDLVTIQSVLSLSGWRLQAFRWEPGLRTVIDVSVALWLPGTLLWSPVQFLPAWAAWPLSSPATVLVPPAPGRKISQRLPPH